MVEEKKTIDGLDPIMLEYPFVRQGMTLVEYYNEKEYYFKQKIEDIKSRKYIPLWKQIH